MKSAQAIDAGMPAVPDEGVEVPKREWTIELSTLGLLHQRGVLSDAEFDSAVNDLRDSVGLKAPDGTTLVAREVRFQLSAPHSRFQQKTIVRYVPLRVICAGWRTTRTIGASATCARRRLRSEVRT